MRAAGDALTAARAITSEYLRALALTGVAQALAAVGDPEQALTAAHAITYPLSRAWALARLAQAWASHPPINGAA